MDVLLNKYNGKIIEGDFVSIVGTLTKSTEWHGIRIDSSVSDSQVSSIGNADLQSLLPIHRLMQAAVINDDESVNYYLDPDDFTKKADGSASTLTGADGQVMIYKPGYYERISEYGDIVDIKWSLLPLPGYTYQPAYWIGQQLGSIDGNNKLCSIHGVMATTNKHRDEYRQAAARRGSTNWCILPYEVWRFLNIATWMKYLDRNTQLAGVLGAGATNASSTDWSNFNSYNPIIENGLKLTLDDNEVPFSVEGFVGGTGTLNSQAACFMGIEHVFGHIWQYIDGLNLHNSITNGARAFICNNPAHFADDTEVNYQLAGNISESDGYIKKMLAGSVLPLEVGGGSSTCYADYHFSYYDNNQGSGWRGSLVGGGLRVGSYAGLAYSSFNYAASYRNASIGSRLCLLVT